MDKVKFTACIKIIGPIQRLFEAKIWFNNGAQRCRYGLGFLVILSLLLTGCVQSISTAPPAGNQPTQPVPVDFYTTRLTSVDLYPDQLSLSEYLGEWELML